MGAISDVRNVRRRGLRATMLVLGTLAFPLGAQARDKLLDETVDFTGTVLFLESKVPALVIGAVRNGEMSVSGFGKIRTVGRPGA